MRLKAYLIIISLIILATVCCTAASKQVMSNKVQGNTKWLPRNVLASSVYWGDWDMDIYDNARVLVYEKSGTDDHKLALKQYKHNDPEVVIYTDKDRTKTDSTVRADIFVSSASEQFYIVTVLPADESVVITGGEEFKGQGNSHFLTTFTSSEAGLLGIKVRVGFYNQAEQYVKK